MPVSRATPVSTIGRAPRWPLALKRGSRLTRGLGAAWPLFAGPVGGRRDLSGNGAHLVLGAAAERPVWTSRPGQRGRPMYFDGGDEAHVAAGDVASLDITGDQITLCASIRPDDIGNANGRRIISKRTDAGGSDVYALFTITPGAGEVWFRLRIGATDINLVFATPVVTGVWQHWVATYDGAVMRLYLNGVQVASQAQTGNIDGSNQEVYLAHRKLEARRFLGAMSVAAIWSRCLSAAEVRELYLLQEAALFQEMAAPRLWPVAAGGLTTVGRALDARWDMHQLAARTASLPYAIRGLAARTLDARWDIRQLVTRALDARWDLRALVSRALDARWNVRALAGRTLEARWSIRQLAGRAADLRWNIQSTLATVARTLSVVWNRRANAARALDARWNVRALAGRTLEARWSIRSFVSRALDTRWGIRQIAGRAANLPYAIRGLVGRALDVRWNRQAFIGRALNLLWNLGVLPSPPPARALVSIYDRPATLISVSDRPATLISVYDRAG